MTSSIPPDPILDPWDNIEEEQDEILPFASDDLAFLTESLQLSSNFITEVLNKILCCTTFAHVMTTATSYSIQALMKVMGENLYRTHVLDMRRFYYLGQAARSSSFVFTIANFASDWYLAYRQAKLQFRNQVVAEEQDARKQLQATQTSYEEHTILSQQTPQLPPRPGPPLSPVSQPSPSRPPSPLSRPSVPLPGWRGIPGPPSQGSNPFGQPGYVPNPPGAQASTTGLLPADRLRLAPYSYSNHYNERDYLIKGSMSPKVTWDGTMTNFMPYKMALEGYYSQQNSSYMFDEEFHALYQLYNLDVLKERALYKLYPFLTENIIRQGRSHLFGAIMTSCRNSNTVIKFLNKHKKTRDGIMVWIELVENQDNDGNIDVHKHKMDAKTRVPYTRSYKGGLLKYLDEVLDGYAGLERHGCIYTEEQKMHTLLNNLQFDDSDRYLVTYCRDKFTTFQQCYDYLRKEATSRSHNAGSTSQRRANVAKQSTSSQDIATDTSVDSIVEKVILKLNAREDTKSAKEDPIKQKYWMGTGIFKIVQELLGPDKMKELRKKRQDALQEAYGNEKQASGTNKGPTQDSGERRQYPARAQVAQTQESDTDSDIAELDAALAMEQDIYNAFSFNSIVHLPHHIYHSFHGSLQTPTMIFDTGADTSIIGQGWEIVEYTGRKATVIGFDSMRSKKDNLDIVHAKTMVEYEGTTLELVIFWAVYNPTAQISLMSTYQLEEGGCQLDTVRLGKARVDGTPGMQCVVFPQCDIKFTFNIQACLLTLPHQLPPKDSSHQLVEISPRTAWDPQLYHSPVTTYTSPFDDTQLVDTVTPSAPRVLASTRIPMDPPSGELATAKEPHSIFWNVTWPVDSYLALQQMPAPSYDVSIQADYAFHNRTHVVPGRIRTKPVDPTHVQPCLGWLPVELIKKTLENTTQLASWTKALPLKRHFKARYHFLNMTRLKETVATDTYFSSVKAIGGDTCAQVFYGCQSHMINVYGMKTESEGPYAYEDFLCGEGIPAVLRRDNSKMQKSNIFEEINRHWLVKDGFTEPHHPQQNPAELKAIKWLKEHSQIVMNRTGAPENTWLFCAQWLASIHNYTSQESLDWKTPFEKRHGYTPDISAYLLFPFWDKIYYLDTEQKYPYTKELPGHFLGVAENVGDALTFNILAQNQQVLTRSVIRSATNTHDFGFYNERAKQAGEPHLPTQTLPKPPVVSPPATPDQFKGRLDLEHEEQVRKPEEYTRKTRSGKLIGVSGKAKRRIGHLVTNAPVLEVTKDGVKGQIIDKVMKEEATSRKDKVDLTDPKIRKMFVYAQQLEVANRNLNGVLSEDGVDEWMIDKIVKHKVTKDGTKVMARWKIGGQQWLDLDLVMTQEPYVCVKYALKHGLEKEGEWKWTEEFKQLIKNFSRHIYAYRTAVALKAKYKFGVEVAKSTKHALQLDAKEGNDLYEVAIGKEMKAIKEHTVFRLPRPGESLEGYKRIPYHMVFDVKFDLRRKARLVAGGNMTEDPGPDEDIYSGVVGIEFVRLLFILASLNDLIIWAADVGNAFLHGINKEKIYIIAGPEFGPELQGKKLIIQKSLYGLKTAAARFHEHLSQKLRKMGYRPSKAEPNLWYKDLGTHYEYIATYVDDLMIASKNPEQIIKELEEDYLLKGVGEPQYYLGGDVIVLDEQWKKHGIKYALGSATYLSNVIPKLEGLIGKTIATYSSPMLTDYHPELDDSDMLSQEDASKYRSFIGSLNWAITLGRFDVQYATNTLARYNMAPRQGHLDAAVRIIGYLKKTQRLNPKILVNPDLPNHDQYESYDYDNWKEFYPEAEEEIPYDMLKPKGKEIKITIWVDADHAHDQVTRRSITGIVIMVNGMIWKTISKRQKTVESATYGSELVASRIAVEQAIALRYTLRMLGVPVNGPVLMLGDNKSVVLNTTVPSSALKKKHCAINYHRVREAIAGRIVKYVHINSQLNIADVLTKPLAGNVLYQLVKPALFANPGETLWPGGNIELTTKETATGRKVGNN